MIPVDEFSDDAPPETLCEHVEMWATVIFALPIIAAVLAWQGIKGMFRVRP